MDTVKAFQDEIRALMGSLQYTATIERAEDALTQARISGDGAMQSAAHLALFEVYYDQSQYDKAVDHVQKAIDLADDAGDNSLLADALTNSAAYDVHVKGELEDAHKKLGLAIAAAINADDLVNEARARTVLGNLYAHQGKMGQMLSEQQIALKLAEASGDTLTIATVLNNIGNFYFGRRNAAKARLYYEKAVATIAGATHKPSEVIMRVNVALAYINSKTPHSFQKGAELAEAALQFARENHLTTNLVSALYLVGQVHRMKADDAQAMAYYQEALALAVKNKDDNFTRTILLEMGSTQISVKAYDAARDIYNRFIDVTPPRLQMYVIACVQLAHIAHLQRRPRTASRAYSEAWRAARPQPITVKLYVVGSILIRTIEAVPRLLFGLVRRQPAPDVASL